MSETTPTNETKNAAREALAEVLDAHVLRDTDPACTCDWDWNWREVVLPSAVDFDPARYRLPADVRPKQHRAHLADAILASPALDAIVGERIAALAEEMPPRMAEAWGGASRWLTTGSNVAALVGDWLREEAADLTERTAER